MRSQNKIICFLLCIIASFSMFAAQFTLNLENDCFIPDKSLGKGDNDYTHGTCLEFIDDNHFHYKLSQNMYAPSDLRRKDHIIGDRPYAGIIYGGFGYEFFRGHSHFWTHYGEIDAGMIGPAAFAGHTQRFIHKILNCKDPQGWHNQLHNEFVVNGQWWEKYNYYIHNSIAIVPRAGVLAGTIEDAIEVGCDLKVGWNLKNDVGNNLMFSASMDDKQKSFWHKLTIYAYIGVDERCYLYNHFLEGSFIRSKDRDQHLDVDIQPFVGEIQCGACIQYDKFIVRYYMTVRQHEFEGQKHSPNYAGLVFGWVF